MVSKNHAVVRGLLIIYAVLMFRWFDLDAKNESWFGNLTEAPISFHLHIVTMGLLVPLCLTEALFAFVNERDHEEWDEHRARKVRHAVLHMFGLCFAVFGVTVALVNHQQRGIPHAYSLHSWVGILVLFLLISQMSFALYTYAFGSPSLNFKASSLPYHRSMGVFIYGLLVANIMMGMSEMQGFVSCPVPTPVQWSSHDPHGHTEQATSPPITLTTPTMRCGLKVLLNLMGLTIAVIAGITAFSIARTSRLEQARLIYYGIDESDEEQ